MLTLALKSTTIEALRLRMAQYPTVTRKHLQKGIEGATIAVHKQAVRGNVPWKTGTLVKTMSYSVNRLGLVGLVFPTRSYAIYVHEGTRPHVIMPVNKMALYWNGAPHPMRAVHHPGSKAQPFLKVMAEKGLPEVEKIFLKSLDNINQEIIRGL